MQEVTRHKNLLAHTETLRKELASVLGQLNEAEGRLQSLSETISKKLGEIESISEQNRSLLLDQEQIKKDTETILENAIQKVTSYIKMIAKSADDSVRLFEKKYNEYSEQRDAVILDIEKRNKLSEAAKEQLNNVLKEIELAKEKIQKPIEFLRQEEARIDQKKTDVDIYAARIQSEYNKVFPGREAKL